VLESTEKGGHSEGERVINYLDNVFERVFLTIKCVAELELTPLESKSIVWKMPKNKIIFFRRRNFQEVIL